MPQIPNNPVAGPSVAPASATGAFLNVQRDPNAFGAGVAQAEQGLGQSMDNAGAQTAQTLMKFQQEYNETAVDKANTTFEQNARGILFGPDGFYNKRGEDALNAMAPTTAALEQSRQDVRSALVNPEQQRMYDYMTRRSASRELYQMQSHATTEFRVYQGDTAVGAINNEINNSSTYWDDDSKFAESLGKIKIFADKLNGLKGIDPSSDAGKANVTHYTSEAWTARIHSIMAQNPDVARQVFDANADQIDASHRANLDSQITSHQWTSMMREETASRRADAVADKQLRQTQVTNESNILADEYSGKAWSFTKLADMVRTQQISPNMLAAIRSARTAAADGPPNYSLMTSMYARIGDPSNPLTSQEVLDHAAQLKQHGPALIQALASQNRREENPTAAGYYASLKSALGGHNVEQGLVDLTKEAGRKDSALWAQAQNEWTTRVRVKGEDPASVLSDMMPRYQQDPVVPAGWPAPRMGAVSSLQDVVRVRDATKAAVANGTITKDVGDSQAQLLGNYARFYLDKQARALAARDALKKKSEQPQAGGKAQLKGVQPVEEH